MEEERKKDGSERAGSFLEKRRETRFPISTTGQRYLELKVMAGHEFVPVIIENFSRHGMQFESPVPFTTDARAECLISISRSLSKDLALSVLVKHCLKRGNVFIIGAAIETVADSTWLDIFVEVHNFIVQRKGTIF